jgi:type IV pilus assembly protein PilY1
VPDSAGRYSTTGEPALFLLALDKPAGAAWTASGTTPNYYKISLPTDSTLSTSNPTGLINFTAVHGSAGEIAQIYLGDFHGKLWKLNFSNYGSTDWNINKLSAYNKGTAAAPIPYPLFIAKTASAAVQPITMAPMVKSGPVINQVNTNYIAFATGKYLENSDKTSTNQNSIYAVFDNGSTVADSSPAGDSVISGRGRLIAGTINLSAGTITVPSFTWGRATSNADASQRSGWYADFVTSGEREISNGLVNGNNLLFSTLIPAGAGAAGSCAASGGSGNLYIVDLLSGNGTITTSTVGLPGTPFLVTAQYSSTVSSTSYPNPSDSTGRRIKKITKTVVQSGTTGSSTSVTTPTSIAAGRLSWRQINNYLFLKNAP